MGDFPIVPDQSSLVIIEILKHQQTLGNFGLWIRHNVIPAKSEETFDYSRRKTNPLVFNHEERGLLKSHPFFYLHSNFLIFFEVETELRQALIAVIQKAWSVYTNDDQVNVRVVDKPVSDLPLRKAVLSQLGVTGTRPELPREDNLSKIASLFALCCQRNTEALFQTACVLRRSQSENERLKNSLPCDD